MAKAKQQQGVYREIRDNLSQIRSKNVPSPWAQVVRSESESITVVNHSRSSWSSTTSLLPLSYRSKQLNPIAPSELK
ncbi:hypothetical protein CCACVL1_10770 [Corchorus capsularis]|uniref:Uncharacterized protein n=1 Tax=Corchorus capsularis TaxID=210143 RepID=A0A1R3IPR7_COCAP|nr:hypothetical protein CCACVL1_10770 [Corchorus capsularis]